MGFQFQLHRQQQAFTAFGRPAPGMAAAWGAWVLLHQAGFEGQPVGQFVLQRGTPVVDVPVIPGQ
ncbi:hypothetical protein D3C78_1729940 [compost metagenome]